MSVNVLIVSHQDIGNAFLKAANNTFNKKLPLPITIAEIDLDADPDKLIPELKSQIKKINNGDGVLILTDLFGSTPSNIAQALQKIGNIRVVTGLNLPMLLRVLNYPKLSLSKLADKAREGGQCGIVECGNKND